ncbi:MAG: oligosaccharide flippase family protein [Candidatus Latescibacteria bacterium]|jgi:O-antigen/teichoic acid export membrane protein|nr:oligosaccharide flippase family protein [Candidatus Latescibacterota bacterium]
MIQSLKRLLSHSALYGISDVLGRSIAFLLVPIYTNFLTTSEYGHVTLVYAFIGLMNVLFVYGMESAFLRYYLLEKSEKLRILSTGYRTLLISSVVLTGLVYVSAPLLAPLISPSGAFVEYVQLAAIVLGLDALNVIPFARLRGEGRATVFASLKLAKVILELAGNIWLVVILDMGAKGILFSNIAGSGMAFLILTAITARYLAAGWFGQHATALFKFALPYIPAAAAVIVVEMIDRFMIERYMGTDSVGVYSAARKLGVGMLLFVNVFRLAWQPFFLETSEQADAKAVFSRVLTYFLAITGGAFLVISFFVDDLVRLQVGSRTFYESAYWAGTDLVPIFLLAYILYGLYVNLMAGVYIEKKTLYLPLVTGAAAITSIGANMILIPALGMQGAAVASVLAYAVLAAGLYMLSRRYYPVQYEWSRLLRIVVAVSVIWSVGTQFGELIWIYRVALLGAFPLSLVLMGFFESEEIRFLKQKMGYGTPSV